MPVSSRSADIRPWRFVCQGLLVFLALVTLTLPGCGGCSKATKADADKKKKAEEAKKEKPKPKPDFERLELAAQPSEPKNPLKAIKPGHWMAATVRTKANNFDFSGELDTAPTNSQGNLLDLERTPFRLTTSRPAVLPKGQNRRLEVSLFVPGGGTRSWVTTHLRDRQTGREAKRESDVFNHMPGYQYFLLGMVGEPDRYRWLKVIHSVLPPREDGMSSSGTNGMEDYYYRVQLPTIKQTVPLPSDSLCWTSLAYIIWDDIDPTVLNADQQQAMIDWLHWGGQLIISGPKTLDLIKHSFIEPYLPAVAGSPLKLDTEALSELDEGWSIGGEFSRPLTATLPWSGIGLEKRETAEFLPGTGSLVVEQRVGRGRIVATAFRLVERDLINWPSFDSFFNACLLRRGQRTYSRSNFELTRLDWADAPGKRLDPERICQLRYFSRDTSLPSHPRNQQPSRAADPQDDDDPFQDTTNNFNPYGNLYGQQVDPLDSEERDRQKALGDSGVAGWNDFGPVASEARKSLKEAAGITIPRSEFVLHVLLGYLIVLVPLNWVVFRLLGRVEWAWIAAPFIAIVCAVVVIWLAQLDIGFARSSTEIAVVELQGGYPRAHVTRYTALYTSLSTTYSVHLKEHSALALPFSTNPRFEMLSGQQRTTVGFRRDDKGAHLTGYAVSSNATGMIHSEHMAELPGALSFEDDGQGAPQVTNGTGLPLREVGVVRRRAGSEGSEIAWIGTLDPGDVARLNFEPADADLFAQQRERSPQTAHQHAIDTLSLRSLVDLAENPERLTPGDVRLVACLDEEVPGILIEPVASQERHATLVVANLRLGSGHAAQPDTNLPRQAKPIEDQIEEAENGVNETGINETGVLAPPQ